MKLTFQSVRWRLLFWHSLLSVALILAVCFLAYKLVARDQSDRINQDLRTFDRHFFEAVFTDNDEKTGPPSPEEFKKTILALNDREKMSGQIKALLHSQTEQYFIAFWNKDGSLMFKSEHTPDDLQLPVSLDRSARVILEQGNNRIRLRDHPAGVLVTTGRDISSELQSLQRLRIFLALGGAGILTAAILGGWWLAGRALKPIQSISHTASRIAEGNLRERINIAGNDSELGQLGHVLNNTFERLASAIDRQKNFTSDASHELRTPLTVILSESQRGLKNERPAEQYREILGHCNTAAKRMREIIESLLLLARQDQQDSQETKTLNLASSAGAVVDLLQMDAEKSEHPLTLELAEAPVNANDELLQVLVRNLISNAISHTSAGTEITIRTAACDDDWCQLEVSDNGPGIPADHLPHLFDRFYRVDQARTQSSGHSGLGLAIAKTIVESHRGSIKVSSSPESGTSFIVRLPRAQS